MRFSEISYIGFIAAVNSQFFPNLDNRSGGALIRVIAESRRCTNDLKRVLCRLLEYLSDLKLPKQVKAKAGWLMARTGRIPTQETKAKKMGSISTRCMILRWNVSAKAR